MKICIVTVYNSENCGSYLQAFALSTYLEQLGHEVFFLKRPKKGSSNSSLFVLKEVAKSFLKARFKQIPLILKRHKEFSKVIKAYKTISSNDMSKMDFCFIGSDTIWDFDSKYFKDNWKLYTGCLYPDVPFAFYAASCANFSESRLQSYEINFNALASANGISVRDEQTKVLLNNQGITNVQTVIDPTLLLETKAYNSFNKDKTEQKYVLIYCFGSIAEKISNQITKIAKENNYRIISIGGVYKWCDKCISASPSNFISYYADAQLVITNTFHGAVFSTLYNRQFYVVTDAKNKINDYLRKINLCGRIADNPAKICINDKIDYSAVNTTINQYKTLSYNYINTALHNTEQSR